MRLYGHDWTRRELMARAGRFGQLAGVRRYTLAEGPEAGVDQVEVRTGAGLRYLVTPSRGMDIGLAEFAGVPFSWLSQNGDVHPSFFNVEGLEWLRTAAGGLLMTCGMTQVGSPCEDAGERLGIHGRLHHTPASGVSARVDWKGDQAFAVISGEVRETRFFADNLVLRREITSPLGGDNYGELTIRDVVTNDGAEPVPLMMLYHFNFGFPLLTSETVLRFPSRKVTPRPPDETLEGYDRWEDPVRGYRERVYYHEELQTQGVNGLAEQCAEVLLENPSFPIPGGPAKMRIAVRWDTANLPRLVQWKSLLENTHVLGIEPSNCWVDGRAAERARGTLRHIDPGEQVSFALQIAVRCSR